MFSSIGHAAATLLLIFMVFAISSGCESWKKNPRPKPPKTEKGDPPPTPNENKTQANAATLKALDRGHYIGLILALIAGILAYVKKDPALLWGVAFGFSMVIICGTVAYYIDYFRGLTAIIISVVAIGGAAVGGWLGYLWLKNRGWLDRSVGTTEGLLADVKESSPRLHEKLKEKLTKNDDIKTPIRASKARNKKKR